MSASTVTYHRFTTEPDVIRHPQRGSETDRSRRAVMLLLFTLLVPGSAQIAAGSRRLGRAALAVTASVWALVLLGAVMYFALRGPLLTMLTQPFVLWGAAVVLAGLAVGWLILWLDTFRLIHFTSLAPGMKPIIGVVLVLLTVLTSGGLGYGAHLVNQSRESLGGIFSGGPSIPAEEGRYNFLLIGADAGEDRAGLRPDSIHVVSVNENSGESLIISIPRNFQNAQFDAESPMREVYPEGYNCGDECIINFLYTEVHNEYTDLYPEAEDPGAEAMMDAVSGTLDLEVSGYVMVDMGGFEELIDAMGGVSVESGGWVPYRGHRPDGEWGDTWWEPGEYTFSGQEALEYARSRKWSSDYNRIQRQQCIQQAMVAQFSPQTLLTRFSDIMQAGEQVAETNLPQSQLGSFLDLAADAREHQPQRLTLGAPDFGSSSEQFSTYPDFEQIHQRVDELIADEEETSGDDDGWFGGSHAGSPGASAASSGLSAPSGNPEGGALLAAPALEREVPLSIGVGPTELQSADTVEEDEPEIDETPEPPTQPDGSDLTVEYLVEAQDTGQEGLLHEAAATNYECEPAG